jgi:hypothetical protein
MNVPTMAHNLHEIIMEHPIILKSEYLGLWDISCDRGKARGVIEVSLDRVETDDPG